MLKIESIWQLELGKANADCDDLDEDSQFGHFTVPELLICSGYDPKGNEWVAIKMRAHLHGYSFDYPVERFRQSSLDIDSITRYISDKKELLEWAHPLDLSSVSRLIVSAANSNLELKQDEYLAESISYTETSDPIVIYPSVYASRQGFYAIEGLTLGEDGFSFSEKIYDGSTEMHKNYNIHRFHLSCSHNCKISQKKNFVFEGVNNETVTFFSSSEATTKTLRYTIDSDPGGCISIAAAPLAHQVSQDILSTVKSIDRESHADNLIKLLQRLDQIVLAEGVFTSTPNGNIGQIGTTIIDKEISLQSIIESAESDEQGSLQGDWLFFLEANLYKLSERLECKVGLEADEESLEIEEHVTQIKLPSPFFPTLFFDGITLNAPFNIVDSDGFSVVTSKERFEVTSRSEGATYDSYKAIAKIDEKLVLLFSRQNDEDFFIAKADIVNILA